MRIAKTLLAAAVFLALASISGATMIMPSSLQKMTGGSDTIVVGRVQSQSFSGDGGKIVTNVLIGVDQYIKAPAPSNPTTLTVRVPGGTSGGTTMRLDLAPTFADGEEVLLFLRKTGTVYVPYALSYGVYRVAGDGITSKVTGPLFSTGQVYDFNAKKMVLNTVPLGGESLSTFTGRIQAEMAKGGN